VNTLVQEEGVDPELATAAVFASLRGLLVSSGTLSKLSNRKFKSSCEEEEAAGALLLLWGLGFAVTVETAAAATAAATAAVLYFFSSFNGLDSHCLRKVAK
jgi:hypothetical protein